jgi:hypothetical protein
MIRLPCSKPTPAGLIAPDHCGAAAWPLVIAWQGLPRKVFRRSIAWPSDSLSTLRGVSYLSTTQDSLPVAGQALLDGVLTRKVPMKGFKVVIYISFPPPKLSWRKRCNLRALPDLAARPLMVGSAPLTSSGIAIDVVTVGHWGRPNTARKRLIGCASRSAASLPIGRQEGHSTVTIAVPRWKNAPKSAGLLEQGSLTSARASRCQRLIGYAALSNSGKLAFLKTAM